MQLTLVKLKGKLLPFLQPKTCRDVDEVTAIAARIGDVLTRCPAIGGKEPWGNLSVIEPTRLLTPQRLAVADKWQFRKRVL